MSAQEKRREGARSIGCQVEPGLQVKQHRLTTREMGQPLGMLRPMSHPLHRGCIDLMSYPARRESDGVCHWRSRPRKTTSRSFWVRKAVGGGALNDIEIFQVSNPARILTMQLEFRQAASASKEAVAHMAGKWVFVRVRPWRGGSLLNHWDAEWPLLARAWQGKVWMAWEKAAFSWPDQMKNGSGGVASRVVSSCAECFSVSSREDGRRHRTFVAGTACQG